MASQGSVQPWSRSNGQGFTSSAAAPPCCCAGTFREMTKLSMALYILIIIIIIFSRGFFQFPRKENEYKKGRKRFVVFGVVYLVGWLFHTHDTVPVHTLILVSWGCSYVVDTIHSLVVVLLLCVLQIF